MVRALLAASAALAAGLAHRVLLDTDVRSPPIVAEHVVERGIERMTGSGFTHGQSSTASHRVADDDTARAASPVGAGVTVGAELVYVDGRLLRFQVQAEHEDGVVVAHGEITRVVVDETRFLSRL
jgi:hypothetical protein